MVEQRPRARALLLAHSGAAGRHCWPGSPEARPLGRKEAGRSSELETEAQQVGAKKTNKKKLEQTKSQIEAGQSVIQIN